MVEVPLAGGVPVMTPLVLKLAQAGIPVADQVIGVSPEAVKVKE